MKKMAGLNSFAHPDKGVQLRAEEEFRSRRAENRVMLVRFNSKSMATEQRYEEICNTFKNEMQEYIKEGFQANDCFPFVFANLIESTGIPASDRALLQRDLMEWTAKIM